MERPGFVGGSRSSSSSWQPQGAASSPRDATGSPSDATEKAAARASNRELDPEEIQALQADDFLLGRTGHRMPKSAKSVAQLAASKGAAGEALQELELALERYDFLRAEAVWQAATAASSEAVLDLTGYRLLAAYHAQAAYSYVLDEMEAALDMHDVVSARHQMQRLWELRSLCFADDSPVDALPGEPHSGGASFNAGAGLGINPGLSPRRLLEGALSSDCLARGDDLEVRLRQLSAGRHAGHAGALVCGLFPDVSCAALTKHCYEVVQAMRPLTRS